MPVTRLSGFSNPHIPMKRSFVCLSLCLSLMACGSDTSTTDTGTKEWTPPTAAARDEEDSDREVLHQMPNSDQIEEAYDAILEKADVDDPELMEVGIYFSKSITGPESDDSHMSVQLVSPKNKNKILSYRYDFPEKRVREPREVTLTTGLGSTEKFIDTYDGFKASLFKKSDIMDFDKADDVYKEVIEKSGYGADKCFVHDLQFKYFPTGLHGSVDVQSTRSITASKGYDVDKAGQTTFY